MTFEHHRDENSAIGRKHGNTVISTLRGSYGASFAPDCQPTDMLSDVLVHLDEPSMRHLVEDHEAGVLGDKLAERS